MNRNEKSLIIASLVDMFKQHDCFFFMDPTYVSVEAINQFKRTCHQAGAVYKVAKNTLILKAIAELPTMRSHYESIRDEFLKGSSAILFFNQDAGVPARLVKGFREKQNFDHLVLKGAYVDGDLFFGDAQLAVLSRYKTKQVLVGEIIALLQAPFARTMEALRNHIKQSAESVAQ